MLMVTRAEARLFRSVLRYTLLDQEIKGQWPLMVCRSGSQGLFLSAQKNDLTIHYHRPGKEKEDLFILPSSALSEFEGRTNQPVILEQTQAGNALARWDENGSERVLDLEAVDPKSLPPFPDIPSRFTPFPDAFRRALTMATQSTAQDNTRYAMSCVQFRGKEGQLIATDGKQLLVQGGFRFGFRDEFLVPRLPLLTRTNLLPDGPFAVGRTNTHLGLKLGPWLFLLRIDTKSRFPNTRQALPDPRAVTCRLVLHPRDVEQLIHSLPKLPTEDRDHSPVTLDLGQRIVVRARASVDDPTTEMDLSNSRIEGKPTCICINRNYLVRALKLGFHQLEITKPDQPLASRDKDRVFVWLPFDPKGALDPSAGAVHVPENNRRVSQTQNRRNPTMPGNSYQSQGHQPPENGRNGHGRGENGHQNGSVPEPPANVVADVLGEAEALRQLLQEANTRLSRLVGALKQDRRQRRVFQQAVASLRHLNLAP